MLELRDLAGLFEAERDALAGELAPLETLADAVAFVARRGGAILEVVVQDEFTHDVVAALPGRRTLVFGAT